MLLCLFAQAEGLKESKRLTDWFEALWFSELVKIPLTLADSAIWYANLMPCEDETCGEGEQISGGKYFVDNQNPYFIVLNNAFSQETQIQDNYNFQACDTDVTTLGFQNGSS